MVSTERKDNMVVTTEMITQGAVLILSLAGTIMGIQASVDRKFSGVDAKINSVYKRLDEVKGGCVSEKVCVVKHDEVNRNQQRIENQLIAISADIKTLLATKELKDGK